MISQASDPECHAAYGAILGACVGDAAGAVLEFLQTRPNQAQVEAALRMPGGGVWVVGPGQVTDDSEMALCLLQALMEHPASGPLPLDDIAHWYCRWLDSPPFDIGMTTQQALLAVRSHSETAGLGEKIRQQAAKFNQESLSNGCLMRVAPLAVWCHKASDDVIAAHAAAEASLTHPHRTAQVAIGAYCIAIAHLIKHPKVASPAIDATKRWLQSNLKQQQLMAQGWQSEKQQQECLAWGTVLEWFEEAQQEGQGPEVHKMQGFIRWGFVHAFRALHKQLSFKEALQQVLLLGGDTDTNAAIVGGLLGAYWGAEAIPSYMTAPVLARNTNCGPGRQRPTFLQTGQLPQLFDKLWAAASR